MYKSLLSLVLIALASLQLNAQVGRSTQYSYDCNAVGAANIGGKEVKYFHVSQYFEDGLVVNQKDLMTALPVDRESNDRKGNYPYAGKITSIPVKGLSLEFSWGVPHGASGSAYLIQGNTRVEYSCHSDWSPY